ncbi:hypothetical protein [Spongiimicrobium sp. 3-5]|uniref:hypothetical protein n=1 Tax=Spongiimicrobium sp. 3-5 TaxID=3332596 RepID=UPI003980B645
MRYVNKKCATLVLVLLFFKFGAISAQIAKNDTQAISIFEHGKISTGAVEYGISFSLSGKEAYFARSMDKWGTPHSKSAIFYTLRKNSKWTTPVLAAFSGTYDDSDPFLTKDGKTLFFISRRPAGDQEVSADIWKVQKDKKGQWGKPVRLNDSINSHKDEYSPRTDKWGNLYFASTRSNGYGQGDLYFAKKDKKGLHVPVNLGNIINSPMGEWNLEINPKGDLLIFEASQRSQNISSYGDLYISFKMNGLWTKPQHLEELNTSGSDLSPYLAKRGKVLFFSSSKSLESPQVDIFYIPFKPIYKKYKKRASLPLP